MTQAARRKKHSKEDSLLFLSALVGIMIWVLSYNFTYAVLGFIGCIFIESISLLLYKNHKRRIFLQSGIYQVDKMSGEQFELFVLAHFKNLGYKGETTPRTNDYGADLILKNEGERIVVQAKRWNEKVGIKAIQEVIGAVKYYKAQKAIVIANNWFTKNAKELAASNGVELWDRGKLISIMSAANGGEIANKVINEALSDAPENKICPRCGGTLVLRNGKNGQFYGCSSFPKCRYTNNIKEVVTNG